MLAMPSKSKPSAPAPSAPSATGPAPVPGEEGEDFEAMESEGPDLSAVPMEALEAELAKRKAAEAAPKGGSAPMAGEEA